MAIPEYYIYNKGIFKYILILIPHDYCVLLNQIINIVPAYNKEIDYVMVISYDKNKSTLEHTVTHIIKDNIITNIPKIALKTDYSNGYHFKKINTNDGNLILILIPFGHMISLKHVTCFSDLDNSLDFISIIGYDDSKETAENAISTILMNNSNLPKIALKR